MLGNTKLADQMQKKYERYLAQIPTHGALIALQASRSVGKGAEETAEVTQNSFQNSIKVTDALSTGQHLTSLRQNQTGGLQKSMLTTFYLGEKTVDIKSTLELDARILSQINNTLSTDLFHYLNQANNRADSLDAYLNLLTTLLKRTNDRMTDLQSKIAFLQGNFTSHEERITSSEEIFFNNLKIFNGPNAEQELGKFIGLQEGQAEVRAKLGAYNSLYDYYNFFKPRLENLITAIKANRDPLVAGVKVVEIENMTLPLIIRN